MLETLAQAVNSLLRLHIKALGVPLDGHVPAKKEDVRGGRALLLPLPLLLLGKRAGRVYVNRLPASHTR